MYFVKFGVISLDGTVTRLGSTADMHSYSTAIHRHYASLRLRSKLQQNATRAANDIVSVEIASPKQPE